MTQKLKWLFLILLIAIPATFRAQEETTPLIPAEVTPVLTSEPVLPIAPISTSEPVSTEEPSPLPVTTDEPFIPLPTEAPTEEPMPLETLEPVDSLTLINLDKLGARLAPVMDAYQRGDLVSVQSLVSSYRAPLNNKQQLEVVLWAAPGFNVNNLQNQVEKHGAKRGVPDFNSVTARLSLDAIAALTLHDAVQLIDLPLQAVSVIPENDALSERGAGSQMTEGLNTLGIPSWHAASLQGAGARVAVIETGFGSPSLAADSNLNCLSTFPEITLSAGARQEGDSRSGLYMAEVICDLAPLASVSLYEASNTVELYRALNAASANGVDVIVIGLDLGAAASPGDGTLGYASTTDPYTLIRELTNRGIVVITAAGNSGKAYKSVTTPLNGVITLDITARPGETINISWNDWSMFPAGGAVPETLRAQLSGAGFVDLVQSTRGAHPAYQLVMPVSCAANNGLCQAALTLSDFAGDAASITVQVQVSGYESVLTHVSGGTLLADAGTLARPADMREVITVGAVCASSLARFAPLDYSGRGPAFAAGGSFNGLPPAPYLREAVKPDLVAPAQMSVSNRAALRLDSCSEGFAGTQAAAAHVAGMAALLKTNTLHMPAFAAPTAAESVKEYLQSRAFELPFGIFADGYDMRYGAGMPVLGAPDFNIDSTMLRTRAEVPLQPVDRLPAGKCGGGVLYAGQPVTNAGAPIGSLERPYNNIAAAITAANNAGANRCVVALPGEHSSPLHITGLANNVDVYGYSSVISFSAAASIYRVQNAINDMIGVDIKSGSIYVQNETDFSFNGFTFVQGAVADQNPITQIIVINGSENITFSNNVINGFTAGDNLINVINGSTSVSILDNRFRGNVNARNANNKPMYSISLVTVEDSGTPEARIYVQGNAFRENKSLIGSYTVRDLPGSTTRSLGWMPLVRSLDSYTDIVNNIFRENEAETVIAALTRQRTAAIETRVLGNVFVGNTTHTEELLLNSGPLVHLFNMQRFYFVNNTVANNNLLAGGSTFGMIIGRGDEIENNLGAANNGSLGSTDARWEIHNNLVYNNNADGGLVADMDDQGGVGCTNLANEANKGAQNNWVSKTGLFGMNNNFGVCSTAFSMAANNNVTADPYPEAANQTRYIVGGADPTNPVYYALVFPPYREDGGAVGENLGVDKGRDNYVVNNFPEFAAGTDVRGVGRRGDGDQNSSMVIDIGAYERSPMLLDATINRSGNEDTVISFDIIDPEYLSGSFPPYEFEILDYPEYYGTHCDVRFNESNRGVVIQVLDDNTAIAAYCPPIDFHTSTTTPGFDPAGTSFTFRLKDGTFNVANSTVFTTVNPVNDQPLSTVLGNNNPAGDIVKAAVGFGRNDSAQLRPYVSFEPNDFGSDFIFSEWFNNLEGSARKEVDYDFVYPSLPTLDNSYADALNASTLQNAIAWDNQQKGTIKFNLSGISNITQARARFQYTVTDSRGGSVTNFLTVSAAVPPSPFALLTPGDYSVIAAPSQLSAMTWESAQNAVTYSLRLLRELNNGTRLLVMEQSFTAAADGDALTCDSSVCTLTAGGLASVVWISGDYLWEVTAYNDEVATAATNNPFHFDMTAGIELLRNGSFENAGKNARLAINWTPVTLDKNDRRLCRVGSTTIGNCFYRFKGGSTNPDIIRQVIKNVRGANKRDKLTLSFFARYNKLTAGSKVILRITYTTGKPENMVIKIPAGNGTFDVPYILTRTLRRKVAKLQLRVIIPPAGRGTLDFDGMSVVLDKDTRYRLLTPVNEAVFASANTSANEDSLTMFTWQTSGSAPTYDFSLARTAPSSAGVISLLGLTADADSDALTCDLNICRFALTDDQQAQITNGEYTWSVIPSNLVPALNGAFTFTVNNTQQELLTNGTFELPGAKAPLAANWSFKGGIGGTRQCNKPGKNVYIAYQGACSFTFAGAPNRVLQLIQNINLNGFSNGNALTLSLVAQATNVQLNRAQMIVTVIFDNGSKQKISLIIPKGSYGFRQFVKEELIGGNGMPTKAQIMLRHTGTAGRLILDNVSLKNTTP